MSGYRHTRSFPLRYTDFDFRDGLKPSALLALAQEAAGSSADELGFGYEALKAHKMGFITVNTCGEIAGTAKFGDVLTVETWPLPPQHVIFERQYLFKNQMGEIVARLASRWCLIDLPRFVMLPPEALGEAHARCPYSPDRAFPVSDWKIPRQTEGREIYRTEVRNSLCDHYLHANNTRYADLALDCFSMEELPPLKAFRIAYHKQAKEGALLSLRRQDGGGKSLIEVREGDKLISQFEAVFGEEQP